MSCLSKSRLGSIAASTLMNMILFATPPSFALAILLACAIGSAQQAHLGQPRLPLDRGAVVLHNGSVLIGQVSKVGEHYQISTEGAMLQVRANDVAVIAESLVDAYERRRARLNRPTAENHLQLAEWCLRQEMWPQAAREVLEARGIDPRHPRLELIARRLALASQQVAKPETPTTVTDQTVESREPSASAEVEVKDVVQQLPAGALERFTRRVQPLLVNNCTTAGCHRESGPSQFQLSRALLYGESNQKSTAANLAATFEQIDHESPRRSPLLTVPLLAHGGLAGSVFPPHRRDLHQQLVEWVMLVTGEATSPSGVAGSEGHVGDSEAVASPAMAPQRQGVVKASYEISPGFVRPPPRVRFGAQPRRFQPRDPFDPATFNRQFADPNRSSDQAQLKTQSNAPTNE